MAILTPDEITILADPGEKVVEKVQPDKISTPLKVVIASSFLLRIAGAATGILLASYLRQGFDAQADLIGTLSALFYVTELLLAPVFGALSDLRGRRWLLVLGPLVGAIALPIYPLSALASASILGVVILAVARLLEGVSTAAKVPSALGYLADATAGEGKKRAALRGRVMGLYEISFLVGMVGGNILGGNLWKPLQESAFFIVAFVYLLATVLLFFFVPESLPAEARQHNDNLKASASDLAHPVRALLRERLKSYVALVQEPALRSFIPAWLAVNAVVGLFGNLVQPLMIKARDGKINPFPNQLLYGQFEPAHVSFIFAGFGIVFMVGILVWSLLYARVRKTTVMLLASAGLFITCLSLYFINDQVPFPTGWNAFVWTPLLAVGLFLVSGFTPVALAYLAEISGARVEHRGAVMGLYSVFLGLGQLIGSGLGGFFITWLNQGFNGLILGTFILGIIAFVAVFWLRVKHGV
ncbi:MAG: MFS transporter [Chloroflexota bacterium]